MRDLLATDMELHPGYLMGHQMLCAVPMKLSCYFRAEVRGLAEGKKRL